jgi:predicted RNA-binding Zn-ribbon protein involved in translation (DUF1610 family)
MEIVKMKNEPPVNSSKGKENHSACQPMPMAYECPACGWSKAIEPKKGEPQAVFEKCPACGNEALESRPPNAIERLLAFMDTLK